MRSRRHTCTLLLWLSACSATAGNVLVFAPSAYQPALGPWVEYRRGEGHSVRVATPGADTESLLAMVSNAHAQAPLTHIVVVGHAPEAKVIEGAQNSVPTAYVPSTVNVAWGGLPDIATDNTLADLNQDGAPEIAVGRIACRSAEQLGRYLDRVLAKERSAARTQRKLNVVASPGRFSPIIDAVIETTANHALRAITPRDCALNAIYASPSSPHYPTVPFCDAVRQSLAAESLAWVYMGHAYDQQLDHLWDQPGAPCMLSFADLNRPLPEGNGTLLAALVCCRAGRLDGPSPCLAERLLHVEGGPLAVIASSRVSMPYGNSVLGAEMLHCLFTHAATTGDVLAEGKRRALQADSSLAIRPALEQIGRGVSPNPDTLRTEIAEHTQMYNLLGDPLLRVR